MAKPKIVSANYRKSDSPFPWLLRDVNQSPKEAKPFKVIKATNVEFRDSEEDEKGFGCTIVACCEKADGYNIPETLDTNSFIELKFDGRRSFHDPNGTQVTQLKTMYLDKNRKIWGEILVPGTEVS